MQLWEFERIQRDGIHECEPPRKKKKRIRPGSLFWYGEAILEGIVLLLTIAGWYMLLYIIAG